ncbi:carotenoid oxygenase family protein [Oscillatoria sp. CS-180]|nr:carotenoid oxygenase family protein [Oscillatoria sp. CS-180]MDB9524982.1 carotenoid oxygenase family protein [Oscillatoria sp. CS-180]
MTAVTTSKTQQKAWAKAIADPAQEFPLTPLSVLSGAIPSDLQGSLYRNGPGRLERQGQRVGHWFDGDGAVLAVHFADGQAEATYRYVRSAGYVDEEQAEAFLYSGYGSLAPGPFWQRWSSQLKNAGNTSVLALPNGILALWEGGWPHRLDAKTLETQEVDALGKLQADEPYSAHPKRHPQTGDIFNFGMVAGANATLNIYRSDVSGRIDRKQSIPLNGIPLVHDFVLADRYLVFCVPPIRLNPLPAVLGFQSFSDALMWQPKHGTQLVVVDADTLEVISSEAVDPWYQWHFGKGFVNNDGDIVLEVVRYENFATNQQLKEIATGQYDTPALGQLYRICVDPETATVRAEECLVAHHCEFPYVPADQPTVTAPTFLSLDPPNRDNTGELFRAIARFDPDTAKLTVAETGLERYPSEPIYVPKQNATTSSGWVLTVIYDGSAHQSELWIYDSDRLEDEPVCRLHLPSVIPHSFHGTWRSRATG